PDPVGDLVAGVRDARGRVAPTRKDHVRAAFVDHRGRPDVPPAGARELFEHVVPVVAQAVGDDTAAGTEERVHTRRVPRFDELARPDAGERLLLLREPRVARAEAAEDLVPEVPPHQPVAERAGLDPSREEAHHVRDHGEVLLGGGAAALHGARAVLAVDPVVAVVTRQDGDAIGLEVGAGREHLVLVRGDALQETQLVTFQKRAAEQFERRERVVDDGTFGQGRTRHVLREHRRPAIDAHALPDHHVGAVLVGERAHALQRLRGQIIVRVQEEDVLAGGQFDSPVARRTGPSGVLLVHDGETGTPGRVLIQYLTAAVGGAVVDRDDLYLRGIHRLLEQRRERPLQRWPAVVHRHDNGHLRALPHELPAASPKTEAPAYATVPSQG